MESFKLTPEDMARTRNIADEVAKKIKARGSNAGEPMGKDSFLKLLVTELRHQDPTQPMADKEFIAQMAQFSSLEQMQGINTGMTSLNMKARSSEAYDLIGKNVEAVNALTGRSVRGTVDHVLKSPDDIRLVVNGENIRIEDVMAVYAGSDSRQTQRPENQYIQSESAPVDLSAETDIAPQRAAAARTYEAISNTAIYATR